ncbi:hypothetical protein RKD55_001163 [Rossellomorea marisflavi]
MGSLFLLVRGECEECGEYLVRTFVQVNGGLKDGFVRKDR